VIITAGEAKQYLPDMNRFRGRDMVEIVPLDGTLLVEARIRPKDIAFLRPGQEATVKLTAYDFPFMAA
jgi:multidrug resistance efflux pump